MQADPATISQLAQIRHIASAATLPSGIDLTPYMPAVGDQGQEGSCASWASAYAMRGYEARRDVWSSIQPQTANPAYNFSPAFVYNQINGGIDAGSTIPAALGLIQRKGVATLADMPYVSGQVKTQPSSAAFTDAANYPIASYGYISPTDITSIKGQLAAGIPVILGFKVYLNFFNLGPGQIYSSISGGLQGGHAVTIVGYDDSKQAFKFINSWGPYWASSGYGWMSYSVMSQVALEAYSAIDNHGTPSPLPTVTPTATPTVKPSPTATPTVKPSPTATPTVKPSPTATPTVKPSPTATPTVKPSPTATPTTR